MDVKVLMKYGYYRNTSTSLIYLKVQSQVQIPFALLIVTRQGSPAEFPSIYLKDIGI